ncbi:mammalian ependymin-related protein 1-like [Lingula anatina]|uniref:Mammalian ependymin-related protein 1-like n=1 Tax=Lingula anatina TaxID=7574 RepID=A0A1S3J1P0_LINAN|nr:mammalian ependymin-related protein 1-like [Lingula anatina]|eukprot:XP_013404178.2 mammalian ependymin-related protein 1-like [Lingula anatina]
MLFAAVCVSLLALAFGAPKPCNCPSKWEGLMGEMIGAEKGGKPWTMQEGARLSVSSDDKKIFSMGVANFSTGQSVNMKVLQDFKNHKQYVIIKGKCTVTKLEGEMMNGVPANATWIGAFYFGSGVGNSLAVDSWKVKLGGAEEELTTTTKDCIPIGIVTTGIVNGADVMATIGMVNVTIGIKDPSVFVVPSICKQVSSEHPSQQLTGYMKLISHMFRR